LMSTAVLYGTLLDDGVENCACGFEWGLTLTLDNLTPTQTLETGDTISQTITGLLPMTTYYYRAFATNSIATVYGDIKAFATPSGAGGGGGVGGGPYGVNNTQVATMPATEIREVSAVLNGILSNDDGYPCAVWFEYGATTQYGSKTTQQDGKVTGDPFFAAVGMGEGKVLHFRAVAYNQKGIVYGADATFSSLSYLGPPVYAVLEDLMRDID